MRSDVFIVRNTLTVNHYHRKSSLKTRPSMVSTLTFEKATQIHGDFLAKIGENAGDAQSKILEFLGWDEADEENFGSSGMLVGRFMI